MMASRFSTAMLLVPVAVAAGIVLSNDMWFGIAAMFALALINAALMAFRKQHAN